MTNERIRYVLIMSFNNIAENGMINSGRERHNYLDQEKESKKKDTLTSSKTKFGPYY